MTPDDIDQYKIKGTHMGYLCPQDGADAVQVQETNQHILFV